MNEESIVLGGGCFWCLEALYQRVREVNKVVSGYSGGAEENPTYESTHGPRNTHAEVVNVSFDPDIISIETILEIFWTMHDPTTRNQQGNDIGVEYRSIILYSDKAQKEVVEKSAETVAKRLWQKPITTEIKQLDVFWPAEDYHQEYFANNPNQPYCAAVVAPKVAKFRQKYADRLRTAG